MVKLNCFGFDVAEANYPSEFVTPYCSGVSFPRRHLLREHSCPLWFGSGHSGDRYSLEPVPRFAQVGEPQNIKPHMKSGAFSISERD